MRKFIASLIALAYLLAATPAPAGFLINSFSSTVPAFSFIAVTTDTTNATVYTFTAASLGTPHPLRMNSVGAACLGAGITSMTVDAQTATVVATSGNTGRPAEIWRAATNTGNATGNIVVTCAGSSTAANIAVWAGYPASVTPVDGVGLNGNSGGVVTVSDVAKTAGGFVTCYASTSNTVNGVITQNGAETIIEDFDGPVEAARGHIAASHISTATTTLDDYTVTWSGGNMGLSCGSWGP